MSTCGDQEGRCSWFPLRASLHRLARSEVQTKMTSFPCLPLKHKCTKPRGPSRARRQAGGAGCWPWPGCHAAAKQRAGTACSEIQSGQHRAPSREMSVCKREWQITNHSPLECCGLILNHLPVPGWCKVIPPRLNDSQSLQSTILFYSRCQTKTFHVNSLQPTPLSALLLCDIYSPVKCAFICWHFFLN